MEKQVFQHHLIKDENCFKSQKHEIIQLQLLGKLYITHISRKRQKEEKEYNPDLKKKYLDIYRSKFEMIASLYEQYVLYHGKKNAEHAVYGEVSRLIEDFLGDNSNKDQLESVLNESMDGIISKSRKEMPKLN